MQRCSYPDCNYSADIVTHNHCRNTHGIDKWEVIKQYGPFKILDKSFKFVKKRTL